MSGAVAELPLGAAAAGGTRLVSEPAFELLFSEIIAYTGAYVAHTAASHAKDMARTSSAGTQGDEEEGGDKDVSEGGEEEQGGAMVEPSPASVGAGNALLPVGTSTFLHIHVLCDS